MIMCIDIDKSRVLSKISDLLSTYCIVRFIICRISLLLNNYWVLDHSITSMHDVILLRGSQMILSLNRLRLLEFLETCIWGLQ